MTRRVLLAGLIPRAKTAAFAYSFKGFPNWPLDRSFAMAKKLGYTGVELFEPRKAMAIEVREMAAKHKLPVVSLMEDVRLTGDEQQSLDQLDHSLRLAKEIGRPVVETIVGGKPAEWPQLKEQFERRLEKWTERAEKHKVVLAIKAHIGSALHTPKDAAELCRTMKSRYCKLNFDYSHFQLQGFSLNESLDAALPFAAMVHIKDSVGDAAKYRFVLPGAGSIDYAGYAKELAARKYSGPVVVEVSSHVLQEKTFEPEAAARFVAEKVMGLFRVR
ncbi:MAG: sugar phosphate isomerase/epimerase [Acidobacteria bacterium]|nr:sugar phosphate isomerase/epimerase [Acidobacteriota bacterium]